MKSLIDAINTKIDNLNSDIDSLLYNEFLLTLQDMKENFKNNENLNLDNYFEKLKGILNIKKDISSNLISYDYVIDFDSNSFHEDIEIELEESVSVSANISKPTDFEKLEHTINILNLDNGYYYFQNLNEDYGEIGNLLNISYSTTNLEDFKLFSLKISGIKLFDNIFIARTLSTSMIKLLYFLFSVNESPFITLCEQNSKYFAKSPSNMKKAVTLKENYCYFESDVDDSEASEMIKTFLNHINVPISACKVLLSCSTTKSGESYITFIL